MIQKKKSSVQRNGTYWNFKQPSERRKHPATSITSFGFPTVEILLRRTWVVPTLQLGEFKVCCWDTGLLRPRLWRDLTQMVTTGAVNRRLSHVYVQDLHSQWNPRWLPFDFRVDVRFGGDGDRFELHFLGVFAVVMYRAPLVRRLDSFPGQRACPGLTFAEMPPPQPGIRKGRPHVRRLSGAIPSPAFRDKGCRRRCRYVTRSRDCAKNTIIANRRELDGSQQTKPGDASRRSVSSALRCQSQVLQTDNFCNEYTRKKIGQ